MKFEIEGEDMVKKEVIKHSDTASHIFVPKDWIGKKVAVILLEEGKTYSNSKEKLREQIKEDLENGRAIIPGSMEEAKKIAGIIDELNQVSEEE